MNNLLLLVFTFVVFLSLSKGWETGHEYVYKYTGRTIVGINSLKQQNAVVELHSRIAVQAHDETTILVKLTECRIIRNGKYTGDPDLPKIRDEAGRHQSSDIDGEEDHIENIDQLSVPFVINHNKGMVVDVEIGNDEELWIVNMKKSIANQLQLDVTGLRSDGISPSWDSDAENRVVNVFEDGISGYCSVIIQTSRLPLHQVFELDAYDLASFKALCQDTHVYEIVKTKDFNRCRNSPIYHSASQPIYTCTLGTANCGDAMQRTSNMKYIGCGRSIDEMTIVYGLGYNKFLAKPFGIDTEEMESTTITELSLLTKETMRSPWSNPSSQSVKLDSLAYVFHQFEKEENSNMYVKPSLTDAPSWRKMGSADLKRSILESLRTVTDNLKEKPVADYDKLERLDLISHLMAMTDLKEMYDLWQSVKNEDNIIKNLFIDCAVQTGSNPTIMLIKQLIESEEIDGQDAIWAMAALGYHAKTPTGDLLRQLVDLVKSESVQSHKSLKQTALLTVADLLNVACESAHLHNKRFPVQLIDDFCDAKDSRLLDEFLNILSQELQSSTSSTSDKIITMMAIGSLGIEEILPVLLPHIEGNAQGDDTAERAAAILALKRVIYINPERVHPLLIALSDNVAERPEVRMAAISMLLHSNAPMAVWQKIASRTWIEPSQQVAAYIYNILESLTTMPPTTSWVHKDLPEKARGAVALAKPHTYGMPYSGSRIYSSTMKEGISAMTHTPMWRISEEHWPVLLGYRLHNRVGPFTSTPIQIFLWNYNMSDLWQNIGGLLSGQRSRTTFKTPTSDWNLNQIWEELKIERRPSDKRTGLLHINLLGSINRVIDLEQLAKSIPSWMSKATKLQTVGVDVSATKYRMLADYKMQIPTEMGLPLLLRFTVPMIVSAQGVINYERQSTIRSDISAELAWKLKSELRVLLPFNGNYVATGVDCRVELRAPKEMTLSWKKGVVNATWTPGKKVTDLAYYHVKPYTISRNTDDMQPTMEDDSLAIISQSDEALTDIPLTTNWGVNIRALASTKSTEHYDMFNFMEHDMVSLFTFVPLKIESRQYSIRYDPRGSRATSVSSALQYQRVTQDAPQTLRFQSGVTSALPSSTKLRSQQPITKSVRDIATRLFQKMNGGTSLLTKGSLRVHQEDGSVIGVNTLFRVVRNSWFTKDTTELYIQKFSRTVYGDSNTDYVLCAISSRNWNNPPPHGFSKEKLYLTDDTRIGFGSSCDQSLIRFKAKIWRNETAALFARQSPWGRQCMRDMASGMKYGSPDCTKASVLDQTYNVYDLKAETTNIPENMNWWFNQVGNWFNHKAYPYLVEHRKEPNDADKFSWKIMRDPESGDVDFVVVRSTEMLVASHIRDPILPIFDISSKYWSFFPISAGRSFYREFLDVTSAGASESLCYVANDSILTFDGPGYNYTLDSCQHVLMTDCWKQSNVAVMARQEGRHKIVTVVSGPDSIVIDPSGKVTVNGKLNVLSEGQIIEIEQEDSVKAIIYPIEDGVVLEQWDIKMKLKIQGSHIMIKTPRMLRGRTCGLCGDSNQEATAEFKSPQRCTLSSGELMAASFKLNSGEGCKPRTSMTERKLATETESCRSVDEMIQSSLPHVDLKQITKCHRYETLSFQSPSSFSDVSCRSTVPSIRCLPGCKPASMISKPFTFQCSSRDIEEFRATITVPVSCITE